MFVDTKETSFLQDLSKPSLEALSYLLRHQELWPEGFEWYFGSCNSCAMGLACKLWVTIKDSDFKQNWLADRFDQKWQQIRHTFPKEVVEDIFFGRVFFGISPDEPADISSVTPEMVADEIDKHLAKSV